MSEKIEITLSTEEMNTLKHSLCGDQRLLQIAASAGTAENSTSILNLTSETAERMRELLTIRLAEVGFRSDYSLTEEGVRIEDLIDKLYVENL